MTGDSLYLLTATVHAQPQPQQTAASATPGVSAVPAQNAAEHSFSQKLPAQNPRYPVRQGQGEFWNASPLLTFTERALDSHRREWESSVCAEHCHTIQFLALCTIHGNASSITFSSRACYQKKDKAKADVALQILDHFGLKPKSIWDVRGGRQPERPSEPAADSSPSPWPASPPDTAGRHSCISALDELQRSGKLTYALTVTADEILGNVTVLTSDPRVEYHATVRNDYNEEWCRNKCAKKLLRKASIVCGEAEQLYKQVDPKLRMFQGDLFAAEEGRSVEFKGGKTQNRPMTYKAARNVGTDSAVGHTVCAFLNTYLSDGSGGSIYIGIHDSGQVHGIDLLSVEQDFGQSFYQEVAKLSASPKWTVVKFHVKVGDAIKEGDAVCDVGHGSLHLTLRSLHDGIVRTLAKNGEDGVKLKNIRDAGFLMKVELDSATAAAAEVVPSAGVAAASASDAAANLGVDASNEHEGATIADSDMREGLVCGVLLSRRDSDELKRSIYSSLMDSIEPRPVNLLNVFLHEVDPPRNQQPPAPRPNKGDLSDEVNNYIDDLEKQREDNRKTIKQLRGTSCNTFVLEIRVAASDRLHYYQRTPYERSGDVAATQRIPIGRMEEIIVKQRRKTRWAVRG
ncbi:hypothetical protein HDU89_006083 [Geranomyces variabilis]|nr:hypothetical protein HDU89_006083 [Geranomyces variabilis]